jgi:hypothetical protein
MHEVPILPQHLPPCPEAPRPEQRAQQGLPPRCIHPHGIGVGGVGGEGMAPGRSAFA